MAIRQRQNKGLTAIYVFNPELKIFFIIDFFREKGGERERGKY